MDSPIILTIKLGKAEEEHEVDVKFVFLPRSDGKHRFRYDLEYYLDVSMLSDEKAKEDNVETIFLKASASTLDGAMMKMGKLIYDRRVQQSKLKVHPQWDDEGTIISEIRKAGKRRGGKR